MRIESKVFFTLMLALVMVCILGCSKSFIVNAVGSSTSSNVVAEFYSPSQINKQEDLLQWWQEEEWETEIITNKVGKEIQLRYLSSIIWPESEEEALAKFLRCEGGNHEEKSRIAQIICWKRNNPEYADTIQEVLKSDSYCVIAPDFWNEIAIPSEDDYQIAREALMCTEKPEYVQYIFKEFYEDFYNCEPEKDVYVAENFVFYN